LNPAVSVIVCAYTERRWDRLVWTVAAVSEQLRTADELLVVVDHNARLLARAREAFPSARVLASDGTRGLSGARNTGVRHARGQLLAFVDDDAVPQPQWLDHLLQAFAADEVIGAGGSALPVWSSAAPKWMPPEFLWVVGASYEGLPHERAAVRNPIGANMAFRREAFERVGGFREGIGRVGATPLGCEETEFAIRARRSLPGSVVMYVPDARVEHHVDSERATWRYFTARCWAEGRSKALVTAIVGAGDGLASERSYVARTLPRGFLAGLSAAVRGDVHGLARSFAIVLGVAATAGGYLRGRRAARAGRSAGSSAAEDFRPMAVRSVELSEPLGDLVAGSSVAGAPYGGALVLGRLRGEPLGLATVPLHAGRASAEDVAERLWASLSEVLSARANGGVSDLGPGTLLRGLQRAAGTRPAPLPAEQAPHVTVIVPTGGRSAHLERCLRSLRALRYPRFDLLVVDNKPEDPATRGVVKAQAVDDGRIRYSAEPRPGSSVARNHGVVRTTAELVAFTDDDVVVEPEWLDWLVRPFLDDPAVGVVTGLVLPAELETPAQWWFEQYGGFAKGFEHRVYDLNGHRADDRLLYPYWGGVFGSGNSMAFRRSSLCAIGGFDPALGAGSVARAGSDIEAFSHVILRGERLVYEPRSVCWHEHRREERALRRQLLNYGVGFTAILTKWALRDPTLLLMLIRRLPAGLRAETGGAPGAKPDLPAYLRRLELVGYLLGPLLYARSVIWARRLRLADVMTDVRDEPPGR